MKEYKYKINGNIYKVAVGDIDDNIAQVEVNGVPYKVELERSKAAAVKSVNRCLYCFSGCHLARRCSGTSRRLYILELQGE